MPTTIRYILFLTFALTACASPEKAMEQAQYTRAIDLSLSKIKKGKEISYHKQLLKEAADSLVSTTLASYENLHSVKIKDWKRVQKVFNKTLGKLASINGRTSGYLSSRYNTVCDVKQEIDLKIVDYYYLEGVRLLDLSISENATQWARQAYAEFKKSKKEGAHLFYDDVEELIEESIERGTIYVDAPYDVSLSGRFIKSSSESPDGLIDCTVSVNYGYLSIDESQRSSREQLSKEVVTGQNSFTDTSGVTTYEDIYSTVTATKTTTRINFTATQRVTIDVRANTAECFLDGKTIDISEEDSCEEVRYSGDYRAIDGRRDEDCDKNTIRNELRDEIEREVDRDLSL